MLKGFGALQRALYQHFVTNFEAGIEQDFS